MREGGGYGFENQNQVSLDPTFQCEPAFPGPTKAMEEVGDDGRN
jgi:hypothetical protein